MSATGGGTEIVKRHNLTISESGAVIAELLSGSNTGVLVHGDMNRVAELFNSNRKTITALWRAYQSQKDASVVDPDVGNKRKGNWTL